MPAANVPVAELETCCWLAVDSLNVDVGAVSESTSTMMQRLEAMESELGALIEALKTGGNRLNADLQLLENNLEEVRDAVNPRPRFQPEASSRDVAPVRRPAPLDAPVLVPEYESEKRHGDALEQAQEKRPGDPLEQAPDQHPRDALEHESAKRHGDALDQAPARRPAA